MNHTVAFRLRADFKCQKFVVYISGALSLGVKRPGREADHSPPSSAEVKVCVEPYLHSPNTPPWRGAQLKSRDNFTFTFTIYIQTILGVDVILV
jgi:hypothetical protein